ncbi:MAG: 3-keto-disaccharide hydrolase, partial [Planctomycetota bacterium]
MRRTQITFLVGALCCAGVSQAAEDGFAPLFGKEGLKGWKVSDWSDLGTPQKVKGTPWKLEAGVLYGLNKRVLKFESKITRGSNGGIGLRFPSEKGDPAYTAMEIQVVDHEVYYRGRSLPKQRTGSIYDEIAPSKDVVKPVGQWNSWEITARGSRVQIVLNGQKVIDVDLSRERKARQKKGPALAERPLKGHIGFQNLNGSI